MSERGRRIGRGAALAALLACVAAMAVDSAAADKKKNAAPVPLAEIHSNSVRVDGQTAYVAQTAGLQMLDVSDPEDPREIGRMRLPATLLDVAVVGGRAYLAAGSHGLYVVDVGDPEAPQLIASYGPAVSVNIGSWLLVTGLSLVGEANELMFPEVGEQRSLLDLCSSMLRTAATGQHLDLVSGEPDLDLGVRITGLKSGALVRGVCELGATAASADILSSRNTAANGATISG